MDGTLKTLCIQIDDYKKLSDEDIERINMLISQLSSNPRQVDREILRQVSTSCRFVITRFNGEIIGMGSLIILNQLTGNYGRIEDVVVDEKHRGGGVGKEIIKELIAIAKDSSLSRIDLSSKPDRVAANKLYESLGFARRDTNVYRKKL